MKGLAVLLVGAILGNSAVAAVGQPNELPEVAAQALALPDSVVLYSLEPYTENPEADRNWKGAKFHGYNCLGQLPLTGLQERTAIAEFKKAIPKDRQAEAMCFDPRHALRIMSGHHTYDFLLCFQCAQMEIYADEKEIANLSAIGSPDIINGLLKKAGIPISFVFSDAYIKAEADEARKNKADWERWTAATPKSQVPFLPKSGGADPGLYLFGDHKTECTALAQEFPDENKRILALLNWYGSGAGPWSGFPSYEQVPEALLLTFSTAKIVTAVQSEPLNETEMEGAARLFGGWDFSQKRPDDRKMIPAALKKALLDHSLKSKNSDKIARAQKAFH